MSEDLREMKWLVPPPVARHMLEMEEKMSRECSPSAQIADYATAYYGDQQMVLFNGQRLIAERSRNGWTLDTEDVFGAIASGEQYTIDCSQRELVAPDPVQRYEAKLAKAAILSPDFRGAWIGMDTAERPPEDPTDFPSDYKHNRARDVIKDIVDGSITKGGRREIRKALDDKEAPPSASEKRDQALGRALRWSP